MAGELLNVILILGLIPLVFCSALLYSLVLGRGAYKKRLATVNKHQPAKPIHVAVLFAAYKNDEVIVESVKRALQWQFDFGTYSVEVLGDHLLPETIAELNALGAEVLPLAWENSTKIKSIKEWVIKQSNKADFTHVLTMDIDNWAEKNVLNSWYKQTPPAAIFSTAQQLERTAEGTETEVGLMDEFSERWNNRIFREGAAGWGTNPALIGSALMMPMSDFCHFHEKIEAVGGYDKQLEIDFFKEAYSVLYLHGVKIFDEKVAQMNHLENQRKRWVSAQFVFLFQNIGVALKSVVTKPGLFYKTLQYALIPKVLHLSLSVLCLVFWGALIYLNVEVYQLSHALVIINTVLLFWVFALSFSAKELLQIIPKLLVIGPRLFLTYVRIIFKLKGANKKFIHTPHHLKKKP